MVENKCVWGWQVILYPVGWQRVGAALQMEITDASFILILKLVIDVFYHDNFW